jgi:hypothetical protein
MDANQREALEALHRSFSSNVLNPWAVQPDTDHNQQQPVALASKVQKPSTSQAPQLTTAHVQSPPDKQTTMVSKQQQTPTISPILPVIQAKAGSADVQ